MAALLIAEEGAAAWVVDQGEQQQKDERERQQKERTERIQKEKAERQQKQERERQQKDEMARQQKEKAAQQQQERVERQQKESERKQKERDERQEQEREWQQKEMERKGKERQQKRATARATLEEALAQVETAEASLDTLNVLDTAIVSVRRILIEHGGALSSSMDDALEVPSAGSDLPELLRHAEGESLNLRRRVRARAKAAVAAAVAMLAATDSLEEAGLVRSADAESSSAQSQHRQQQSGVMEPRPSAPSENDNTCVVCLEAPKNTLVYPCKHMVMCGVCTEKLVKAAGKPAVCPVCRSRIVKWTTGIHS
jgi:myosin heavy subunit